MYKNILYIYNELFFCMDLEITSLPFSPPCSQFEAGLLTDVSYISPHTCTHKHSPSSLSVTQMSIGFQGLR